MAAIVDEYLDSPMDSDDVFPCKGCGEILEEGKAFELAGNRWHLDCFRCNTCGTLLDSDANLLLLGDGSLICNNCTYSCSACGDKIEDLAILTGDQAFCSACFRCRNCKRKIENLRYARTTQGIFCMSCHETLMARRRKKSKAAAAAKARDKDYSPMVKEKSLPALPPNVIPNNAFSNDRVDPDSDTPTELSPRPRVSNRHNDSTSRGSSRPSRSPERPEKAEGLGLPPQAYRNNRNSAVFSTSDAGGDTADSFFIPVALDPSPGPSAGSRPSAGDSSRKDYFGNSRSSLEKRGDSHSSTPHIAFQDKGRQHSSEFDGSQYKQNSRKPSRTSSALDERPSRASPSKPAAVAPDEFKLQEAPRSRPDPASRSSSSESSDGPPDTDSNRGVPRPDKEEFPGTLEPRRYNENIPPVAQSPDVRVLSDEVYRGPGDSTVKPLKPDNSKAIARKELPSPAARSAPNGRMPDARRPSATEEASRPSLSDSKNANDSYIEPRVAPAPPVTQTVTKEAGKEDELSPKASPKLPRWSSGGDFTMDEDMARILGTDEGSSSILRRVSNAVRHGRTASVESIHPPSRASHTRSISETARGTPSPRWPKTPAADEISSPMSTTSPDDPAMLKRQLRNSEQKVAELERKFNTENDIKSLNKKLIEKRKTVVVLDTQTEIMIRQLEVLAGYVEKAKETKTPIDPRELEDSALKDFVQKLERVKIAMSESIEQLHEERDQLVEERDKAAADRDRALMEFEQLSSKNAQLADMNNDLTHQIQGRFKTQAGGDVKSPNGLGIYSHTKAASSSGNLDASSMTTGPTLIADDDAVVEAGPTVVQVRKGQVRKFNWKKGGKSMAQKVGQGVNRAVVAFQNDRERIQHQGLTGENIGMPYNSTVQPMETPVMQGPTLPGQNRQQGGDRDRERQFGFFGKKNAMPKSMSANAVSAALPAATAEAPNVLFGSELAERAEYERRQIPTVVTRCIEEVELRGMDQEGIYRKTGGNSQVNMIKDGFDKSESYDISDPDIDITAVTSVLKQYFRKLPNPLLTFEIYDQVLESNAIADETERCRHLHKVFSSMPQQHSDCLEFLMFHLARVAQREKENLMSPKNLAVVFAPTIMRDLSIEREMTDTHAKNLAVQFVIENSHIIFNDA